MSDKLKSAGPLFSWLAWLLVVLFLMQGISYLLNAHFLQASVQLSLSLTYLMLALSSGRRLSRGETITIWLSLALAFILLSINYLFA